MAGTVLSMFRSGSQHRTYLAMPRSSTELGLPQFTASRSPPSSTYSVWSIHFTNTGSAVWITASPQKGIWKSVWASPSRWTRLYREDRDRKGGTIGLLSEDSSWCSPRLFSVLEAGLLHAFVCACMFMHVRACVFMHVHARSCVCLHVHVCACVFMYVFMCVHVCMCVHVYACMFMYVLMYVHA